jgi:hypothetical protein
LMKPEDSRPEDSRPEDLKPEDLIKLGDQKSSHGSVTGQSRVSHGSVTGLHPWISTQVKMIQLNIIQFNSISATEHDFAASDLVMSSDFPCETPSHRDFTRNPVTGQVTGLHPGFPPSQDDPTQHHPIQQPFGNSASFRCV